MYKKKMKYFFKENYKYDDVNMALNELDSEMLMYKNDETWYICTRENKK